MALGDPPADYPSLRWGCSWRLVCIVVGHLLEANSWMNKSITTLVILSPTASDPFSLLP
jgi:hypothetical protein